MSAGGAQAWGKVEEEQAIEVEEQVIEEEEQAIEKQEQAIEKEEQVTKLIGAQCIQASNQIGRDWIWNSESFFEVM